MISRRRWLILALVLLAFICLPYLFSFLVAGKDYVFNGYLLNFGDNNSYLAKMYEGWNGSWRFTLPYTAEPGQGGYIFLYYLFLGHLARWLGLPLLVVFHGARILGSLLMLASLAHFMTVFLGGKARAWTGLLWAAIGSGLGWLVLLTGYMTADTWVVDGFPFLSAFTNPHFTLGLALMLWAFSRVDATPTWRNWLVDFLIALGMGIISPFSVVVTLVVLGGDGLWRWRLAGRAYWRQKGWVRMGWDAVGGGIMLVYQFWLTQVDPVLAIWNAQNLTSSPPPWDLLFAFSPALLLAGVGGWRVVRRARETSRNAVPAGQVLTTSNPGPAASDWPEPARLLVVWAVLGLLLLYVPFGLQRRFILGLYIPLVALAVLGLERFTRGRGLVKAAALGLSLPTNVILVVIMGLYSMAHNPILYLTRDEASAMAWIRANTAPQALVLAAPDTGTLIPANTGRRVIYGHQYETINADQEKQTVEDYFAGRLGVDQAQALIAQRGVDLVFCGPREQAESGGSTCPAAAGLPVVFQQGAVTLYAAHP